MKRFNDWLRGRPPQSDAPGLFRLRMKKEETPSIICVGCEPNRVPLWDEMEQCFASPDIQQRASDDGKRPVKQIVHKGSAST